MVRINLGGRWSGTDPCPVEVPENSRQIITRLICVPYQPPDKQSFNRLDTFQQSFKKQGGIIYHVPRTGTKTLTTSNADVYYLSGVHFVSFSGLFGSETGRARLGTITNMLHTFQQSLKYPRRFALSCSKENKDCKVQRLQMCIGCLASMLSQLFCSRMGRPRKLKINFVVCCGNLSNTEYLIAC